MLATLVFAAIGNCRMNHLDSPVEETENDVDSEEEVEVNKKKKK